MAAPYKPDGYPSLAPYVVADGAQRVIDFAAEVFGATTARRFDHPHGSVMHAEIRVDDTLVMLTDGTADFPAFPAWFHLYVDAAYERALAAGGQSVQEPEQKDDPDRRGGVLDPAGNTWWIATQVAPAA